jgi:hypothetical protein
MLMTCIMNMLKRRRQMKWRRLNMEDDVGGIKWGG